MLHQEYTDLFLLGGLVPLVADTSAIAPELLEKLGRFRDFEALTAEDQLHHLDETIALLSDVATEEVVPPATNNAIFDCYFRIRRVNSPCVEAVIRSTLIVFRNAILNGQHDRHRVSDQEWRTITSALPLIVEKMGGLSTNRQEVKNYG